MPKVRIKHERTTIEIDGKTYTEDEAYQIYNELAQHFSSKTKKDETLEKLLKEAEKESKNKKKEKGIREPWERITDPLKPWLKPDHFRPYLFEETNKEPDVKESETIDRLIMR